MVTYPNAEKSIILQKLADKLGLSYPYYFLSAISKNLDIGQFVERRVNLSKSIRRKVLERDNYQCVKCGSKENLKIHHKIPYSNFLLPRNANKLENLVTLCKKCHQSEHKVEVKVSEEFLKLLKREKERYGLKSNSKTAKKRIIKNLKSTYPELDEKELERLATFLLESLY